MLDKNFFLKNSKLEHLKVLKTSRMTNKMWKMKRAIKYDIKFYIKYEIMNIVFQM